jgi:hypothetical protein
MSHRQVRVQNSVLCKDTAGQKLSTSSDPDAQASTLQMTVLVLQMLLSPRTNALT